MKPPYGLIPAWVELPRFGRLGAVYEDVLPQRSVEPRRERVALEPVVDGDVELAGSGKALHLVQPAGAGTSSRLISGVLGSSRAISPPGGTSRRAGRARSPPAPGRVVASWLGGGEAGARAGLERRDPRRLSRGTPLGSSRLVSANLDGHDVRVPEERVAVVVGVRDVGEGEVVHLSARQPRLELARACRKGPRGVREGSEKGPRRPPPRWGRRPF